MINEVIKKIEQSLPAGSIVESVNGKSGEVSLYFSDIPGVIPPEKLPSYVDDIVEIDSYEDLPSSEEAETGKVYLIVGDNEKNGYSYRWSGTSWVIFSNASALSTVGSNYIIAKNGDDLIVKYNEAYALNPSSNNEVNLIILPGNYIVENQFNISHDYLNVIGLGSTPKSPSVFISCVNVPDTPVLATASNVRIVGLSTLDKIFSLGRDVYSAVFENCSAGDLSFGYLLPSNKLISSTFIGCVGGDKSFGSYCKVGETARFLNCEAGSESFGGTAGELSSKPNEGTFIDCKGGGLSFAGNDGIALGEFKNCIGGEWSFGGMNGRAEGIFTNCVGGEYSFGGPNGVLDGNLYNCRLTSGSFINLTSPGVMINCVDGFDNIVEGKVV